MVDTLAFAFRAVLQGNRFLYESVFFDFQTDLLTFQQPSAYYYHNIYQITIISLTPHKLGLSPMSWLLLA